MKREIMFRGKGLNTEQWFHGGVWYSKGVEGRSDEAKIIITTIDDNGEVDLVAVPVDPKTVGQYTGLTEGGGVDIYEGDKCLDINGKEREVKYKEGSWSWMYYENPSIEWSVIGNIYESK
jgi:hypothetical protein